MFNLNKIAMLAMGVAMLAMLHSASAANKVGETCTTDSNCGTNEVCVNATWIEGGCSSGVCQCKECFTTGDWTGFTTTTNDCAMIIPLHLGAKCAGTYNEIILPAGASCDGGVVRCNADRIQSGYTCTGRGGVPEGGACGANSDCQGIMMCDTTTKKCRCSNIYDKFVPLYGTCEKREIGDPCTLDTQCNPVGQNFQGLTNNLGRCLWGRCACQSTDTAKEVMVAYIDGPSGTMRQKNICIHKDSTVVAKNGTGCSQDPVNAGTVSINFCDGDSMCSKCYSEAFKCRRIVNNMPRTKTCYQRPYLPTQTLNYPFTTFNWTVPWVSTDYYLASVVNKTIAIENLRQCATKDNCKTNEVCLMPSQCGRGVCYCQSPNYVADNGDCMTPTTSTTTTTTSTTSTTTTSTTTTSTTTTTTTTTTRTSTTSTATTTTTLPKVFYKDKCTVNNDCARVGWGVAGAVFGNNLVCKQNVSTDPQLYCLCDNSNFIWREAVQQCVPKDYDDPCEADGECNNGLYVKTTAGGHKCSSAKKCGCETSFTPVKGSVLMAPWGSVVPQYVQRPEIDRTYCVPAATAVTNVSANGNCTLNILDRTDSSVRICNSGLVCLGCPLDNKDSITHKLGTCVQFTYPAPPSTGGSGSGGKSGAVTVEATAINLVFAVLFAYMLSTLRP